MNDLLANKGVSLALADSVVSHLLDHVENILWAKEVFKKTPQYTVEYLLTEARCLSTYRFMPYDPRADDQYLQV